MERLIEYVKIAEAAEILGVSRNTVRAWGEAGRITMHVNPANRYRLFRRQDLEMLVHPTKAYLDSWIARILSRNNSSSRYP